MRVAIVGAGVTGLTAAHRLCRAGHACDVYERWPGLGGQAATLDVGGGVRLERYYHHLFPTDGEIAALYEELGMRDAIEWLPSSVAVLADGIAHPFNTPLDLLRFEPLKPLSRLRVGAAVLALQLRAREVEPYEWITAREWITRWMGRDAWSNLWGPLLRNKFGDRAEDLAMAWLWSKLTIRRRLDGSGARGEVLGYPRGGWQPLFERLRQEIEAAGGRVLIDRPVAELALGGELALAVTPGVPGSFRRGHDPREFEPAGEPVPYDSVVATVPGELLEPMLSPPLRRAVGERYLDRLTGTDYHAALCLLLELDRDFGRFYWTNVADPELPFLGLIEQTRLIPPERYGGRHFLYVANYLEPSDPLLELDGEALLRRYAPGLREVRADFDERWIQRRWLFREPHAQPIVTPGYGERIPWMRAPVPGLVVANSSQIYPEDRGTNYSVRLGERAAALVDGRGEGLAG